MDIETTNTDRAIALVIALTVVFGLFKLFGPEGVFAGFAVLVIYEVWHRVSRGYWRH